MPERSFLEARRASSQDATRPSDRIAIGSALIGGIIVAAILIVQGAQASSGTTSVGRLFSDTANQSPRVQSGHVPELSAATAAVSVGSNVKPMSATPPSNLATATPPRDSGPRRQVAHTDGDGVVLRASPRDDDWTPRGFMDGEWITVVDQSGPDWALVLGDNGEQGWVPARYLAP